MEAKFYKGNIVDEKGWIASCDKHSTWVKAFPKDKKYGIDTTEFCDECRNEEKIKKENRMTFKKFLNEEWVKSVKINGETVELFKNPVNFSEPPKARFVRGILDVKGDLLIWDGNTMAMHSDVADKLNLDFDEYDDVPLYFYAGQKRAEVSTWNTSGFKAHKLKGVLARVKSNRNVQRYVQSLEPKVIPGGREE